MPLQKETLVTAGQGYATLGMWIGPVDHTAQIRLDVSDLTFSAGNGEVDADGYLKPGVPLKEDGTLLDGTAGEFVYGVVLEPVKVAAAPVAADTDLDDETDIDVTVGVIGQLNRAIVEDNLGRALNANELAAFDAAGSLIRLFG